MLLVLTIAPRAAQGGPPPAGEAVNGANVTRVVFTIDDRPRVFVQEESGEWRHAGVAFRELSRDVWSVYLESGEQAVQLDLWKKQVTFRGPRNEAHPITASFAGPRQAPRPNRPGRQDDPAPVAHDESAEPVHPVEPAQPEAQPEAAADPDPSGPREIYEDIPDMPDSDLAAVLHWIEVKTIGERLPFCWRQSYGNGVGVPLSTCPPGSEKDGLLCYPPCEPGYTGVGPVCWQDCPPGYRDDGAFCAKPAEYGRGAGRVPDVTCPAGFSQRGIGAAAWCDNGPTWPWDLKTVAATIGCHDDEEMNGGLCYPKCQANFHAVGCCVCSPDCPADFGADIGVSCTKKSYGRGAGSPMICEAGLVEDAGLCYPPCQSGFHLVGPVCWQDCSDGWQPCGAGCSKNSDPILGVEAPWRDCATTITDQVLSTVTFAANLATLGLSTPATGAAHAGQETITVASKTLTGGSRVGKRLVSLVKKLQTIKPENAPKDATVVRRIYAARAEKAFNRVKTTKDVVSGLYDIEQQFETAFAEDFAEQTSEGIAREIDNRFEPRTALYIKKCWGNVQLQRLAAAEGMEAAQNALGLISIVDISGVTGVVAAFAKPVCQTATPFPELSQSYR